LKHRIPLPGNHWDLVAARAGGVDRNNVMSPRD